MVKVEISREFKDLSISEYFEEVYPEILNIKKIIKQGEIRLNSQRVKKDYDLNENDILEFYLPKELYFKLPVNIIYEDSNLLVINKHQGVPVVTQDPKEFCLIDFVRDYMEENGEINESIGAVPFSCNKMDDNTGGLIMFAKNADVYEAVRVAFKERRLRRVFKAIICGEPKYTHGEFSHFYFLDDKGRAKIAANKSVNAVAIYTKYDVIRTNGSLSEVYLEPVTQIYNQERMQTQMAGYPILGDCLYGNSKINKKMGVLAQALWVCEIEFISGVRNVLEYMNGKKIYTKDIVFPYLEI